MAPMDSTGTLLFASRKAVEDCWREFWPVAHLWTGWKVAELASGRGAERWLMGIIGLAEVYLAFAANHHPPTAGRTGSRLSIEPLVDPELCWRMPPDMVPPLPPLPRFTPGANFAEIMRRTPA